MTWQERLGRLIGLSGRVTSDAYAALGEDLGIVTQNGFCVLLCQGTALPARYEEIFSTRKDDQGELHVKVHRRGRGAHESELLGTLAIHGISPAPAGVPQIEVVLLVDRQGVVRGMSLERGSGRRIESSIGRVTVVQSAKQET